MYLLLVIRSLAAVQALMASASLPRIQLQPRPLLTSALGGADLQGSKHETLQVLGCV